MTRREPGRPTRQILSGSQLARPSDSVGGRRANDQALSVVTIYFLALAILVVISAIVWAIWGNGPASAILLVVALGLIASWLVV